METRLKSLYIISQEAMELASLLEDGELNESIESQLVINQSELQEKAINYGYVIKTIESDISAIDSEMKRLKELKTAKENAVNRMKESVISAMNIYGLEKITSPTLNLSIRKSKAVEVIFEGVIPDRFRKVKEVTTIDKVGIKKAIEAGETIDGAVLNENDNLQIK